MAIDSEAPPGAQEEHGFLPIPDVKAWRSIYASRGDEPRHRRAADAVLFVFGAAGLLVASLIANSGLEGEATATEALRSLLDWLDPVWRVAYVFAGILALALIVDRVRNEAPGARHHPGRRPRSRDRGQRGRRQGGRWHLGRPEADLFVFGEATFPPVRIAACFAVIATARPDLSRPMRRFSGAVVVVAALAAVVLGESSLSGALAAASVGILVTAFIYLVIGSHAGFPPESRVRASLAQLGLAVGALDPTETQIAGVATYETTDSAGRALLVKVYGRDARDSQLVARLWRTDVVPRRGASDGGEPAAPSRARSVVHARRGACRRRDAGRRGPRCGEQR